MGCRVNVLMLGWELPPYISGGLGTACAGLLQGIASVGGVRTTFVLPDHEKCRQGEFVLRALEANSSHTVAATSNRMGETAKDPRSSALIPSHLRMQIYARRSSSVERRVTSRDDARSTGAYTRQLDHRVQLYATTLAANLSTCSPFDVIHAHDWLTYEAGIEVKRITGKKLLVHVHSTEYDRAGDRIAHPEICAIESRGFRTADKVIAVSHYTKQSLVERYQVDPQKVEVVYNAGSCDIETYPRSPGASARSAVVSFIGRITRQKGPESFIDAAHKIHQQMPDVRFVMAGDGDSLVLVKSLVRCLGLEAVFSFPGFLSRRDVWKLFAKTSALVVPSMSEPFGIVALEAVQAGVPVVLTRHSGFGEVMQNVLKVAPEATDDIASQVLSILSNAQFARRLADGARQEALQFSWVRAGQEVCKIYQYLNDTVVS